MTLTPIDIELYILIIINLISLSLVGVTLLISLRKSSDRKLPPFSSSTISPSAVISSLTESKVDDKESPQNSIEEDEYVQEMNHLLKTGEKFDPRKWMTI